MRRISGSTRDQPGGVLASKDKLIDGKEEICNFIPPIRELIGVMSETCEKRILRLNHMQKLCFLAAQALAQRVTELLAEVSCHEL